MSAPVYRTTSELIAELEALLHRAHDILDELRGRFGHDPETAPPPDSTESDAS
jgi:hypothetical protein